jgi:putative YhdH/YhfP family quinone oxidoreductase
MPATSRFSAYLVTRNDKGACRGDLRTDLALDQLPPGELLIRVQYSSINYKDALSATGHPGVTRAYPHIPGIDAAGTVADSSSGLFAPGDPVLVTGYRLGMDHWGGFAQYVRVPAEWAVPLPAGMTALEAMRLGTAGFTAALCLDAILRQERRRDADPVLVTGATGGVAMVAIALLARLGIPAVALTRKEGAIRGRLRQLGAQEVLDPRELEPSDKPLLKERWAAVVDTIGGPLLEHLLKATCAGGTVAACGMAAGNRFTSTVYPFILRGVSLAGIDSAETPSAKRVRIWNHLATDWKVDLERISSEVALDGIDGCVREILAGTHVGRTVVKIG